MNDRRKSKRVPASRFARLANFGGLASSLVGNVVKHTTGQIMSGQTPSLSKSLSHPSHALSIAEKLSTMRGAAMKLGQLLSMDAGEILPEEWEPILARLRENAYSMPKTQLLSMLNQAWGSDWQDNMRYFSFEPIAAASIGQVHKAILKDGTELAVKVQYPGIKQSINSDVDNLASLIKLSGVMPKHVDISPLLSKAKAQLHEEADYRKEASNIQAYQQKLGESDTFCIPKVHKIMSTDTVLSMQFLSGETINNVKSGVNTNSVITRLFELMLDEIFIFKLTQSDPNYANFLFDEKQRKIMLLDFGATREIQADVSENYLSLALAMQSEDTEKIRVYLSKLSLIDQNIPDFELKVIIDACVLAGECLRATHYNFKEEKLIARLQTLTQPLIENKVSTSSPDFDVALINRKVTGMVLLANRMNATVNLPRLLKKYT